MPTPGDMVQFFHGQVFQNTSLPNADFTGKTVVITGANTGLGLECAKQLTKLGVSTLIFGCRNTTKGEDARKAVLAIRPTVTIHVWPIDMANYASVKSFAARLEKEQPLVDAVIVNAGISTKDYHMAEGLEETLTVNVISSFLLALLVLPVLQSSALKSGSKTHLTITGSQVHALAAHEQLEKPPTGKMFSTLSDKQQADMGARYFLSKMIVLQVVQELAKRTIRGPGSKVIINNPNPGWCKTELFRSDDGGFAGRSMLKLIGRTGEEGARALTSAIAAGPETNGRYLSECRIKPVSAYMRSQAGLKTQAKVYDEVLSILERIQPGLTNGLA